MTGNRLHASLPSFENFARHATPICPYRLQATRRTKVETKGDTENEGEISRGSPCSTISLSLSLFFPLCRKCRSRRCDRVRCTYVRTYVQEERIESGFNRARTEPEPEPRESAPAAITTGFDAGTFSARPLPTTVSAIPKPHQSRNPHSGSAHRGDGSVATLQLASVSVLASYSGGLRPSLPSLCLPARVTRK